MTSMAEPNEIAARNRRWDVVFGVIAVAFLAASAFHAWRAIDPVAGDPTSPARHTFWIFADIVTAAAVFFRPPYIVVAFTLFLGQQLYSHGSSALEAWLERSEVSGGDWLIVVCMPTFYALICIDARRRARARAADAPSEPESAR